ncbi:hypothetical protein E2C01_041155 [Portunus trituberculatus]|uniref:Uncharacterized protein n=1 Tax=Portunus trituberculatus TaxID=210409 RepID=A0A5B7FIH4_PORTR|nr:hypothetical protein [Portunus trituberculatus]
MQVGRGRPATIVTVATVATIFREYTVPRSCVGSDEVRMDRLKMTHTTVKVMKSVRSNTRDTNFHSSTRLLLLPVSSASFLSVVRILLMDSRARTVRLWNGSAATHKKV